MVVITSYSIHYTKLYDVKLKGCLPQYFHVTEWSMSFNDALERAEEMRISKLHSLEKQAKKISSMQFKVVEKE